VRGYAFDPSRLRRSPQQLERDGYALAGQLLRDHLGGDPLAGFRRRARRAPVLRGMFAQAAAELALAVLEMEQRETDGET
jgi:hypothetical protein